MKNLEKFENVFGDDLSDVLILNCTDHPLQHWSLSLQGVKMAINVNRCGLEPMCIVRDGKIFIGAEQGIFIINIETKSIDNMVSDVSNVQWIDDDSSNQIVIAAEDEIIVLDNMGEVIWRKNLPDVISTTDIRAECLHVVDMSGEEYEFNLIDGSCGNATKPHV